MFRSDGAVTGYRVKLHSIACFGSAQLAKERFSACFLPCCLVLVDVDLRMTSTEHVQPRLEGRAQQYDCMY